MNFALFLILSISISISSMASEQKGQTIETFALPTALFPSEGEKYKVALEALSSIMGKTVFKKDKDSPERVRIQANLMPQMPEIVIVSMHGLYGSQSQFREIYSQLEGYNINLIKMTLAGHGAHKSLAPNIKYQEWQDEISAILNIARKLGKKVIIMGQSTGGLLAVDSHFRNPELSDGLILIEPALDVDLDITAGACLLGSLVEDTSEVAWIADLFVPSLSGSARSGDSPAIGCEVVGLAEELEELAREEFEMTLYSQYDVFKRLGRSFQIPVLMINNVSDEIVNQQINRSFAAGLPYGVTDEESSRGLKHGETNEVGKRLRDSGLLVDFLDSDFSLKKYDDSEDKLINMRRDAHTVAKKLLEQIQNYKENDVLPLLKAQKIITALSAYRAKYRNRIDCPAHHGVACGLRNEILNFTEDHYEILRSRIFIEDGGADMDGDFEIPDFTLDTFTIEIINNLSTSIESLDPEYTPPKFSTRFTLPFFK
jgi:pimeloyl-ACP methyl ester carboxylesterase